MARMPERTGGPEKAQPPLARRFNASAAWRSALSRALVMLRSTTSIGPILYVALGISVLLRFLNLYKLNDVPILLCSMNLTPNSSSFILSPTAFRAIDSTHLAAHHTLGGFVVGDRPTEVFAHHLEFRRSIVLVFSVLHLLQEIIFLQ